jgi:hypothetical protein
MRLKHQPLWLLHALSNGADATSTVGFGQRRRVRMESLERSIRQIRSPTPVGGSTRSRNSALRWKDRESNPAPAVANTPYRQRACAAPLFTTTNFHFVNGHLTDPYLAVRLRAPVPLLTLGSCLVPASTSLSSAFFSLRQGAISSALGMNALQSLSTSGVHARRCSSVPCAKQGAGEAVAGSMATNNHHCAKGIDRNSTTLFWLSLFIGGPAMHNRSLLDLIMQISIHPCWSLRLSRNVRVYSFRPRRSPYASQILGAGHRADRRVCSVQSASYQRRVRTNHQVVTHLSKRREQHQR